MGELPSNLTVVFELPSNLSVVFKKQKINGIWLSCYDSTHSFLILFLYSYSEVLAEIVFYLLVLK